MSTVGAQKREHLHALFPYAPAGSRLRNHVFLVLAPLTFNLDYELPSSDCRSEDHDLGRAAAMLQI